MVAKVTERLVVSKQEEEKFDVERFNLRKLNGLEVGKRYEIEISNRFAILENFINSSYIKRARGNI